MKVLLVDDSGTMRTIQKRCLVKLGVEDVVEAEDGVQALALFGAGGFDVVLTDWNMPNMDGLTLLKEIRQQNREIPVIMITTEAERASRARNSIWSLRLSCEAVHSRRTERETREVGRREAQCTRLIPPGDRHLRSGRRLTSSVGDGV